MSLLNNVFKLCKVTRASLTHLLLICGLFGISAPSAKFSTRSLPSSCLVYSHQTLKHCEILWSLSLQLFFPKNIGFALLCDVLLYAYMAYDSTQTSRGPLYRYLDGSLSLFNSCVSGALPHKFQLPHTFKILVAFFLAQ